MSGGGTSPADDIASRSRFAEMTDLSPAGAVVFRFAEPTDATTLEFVSMNRVAAEVLGVPTGARLDGVRVTEILHPATAHLLQQRLITLRAGDPPYAARDIEIDERPGRRFNTWAARLSDGTIGMAFEDDTERAWAEERLRWENTHDELTGLPNRRWLLDRLGADLCPRQGSPGPVTLLLVDLDRFRDVNEALGHAGGDDLLRTLAVRLRDEVGPLASVARMGGDEFAVLVGGPLSELELDALARRLLTTVEQPAEPEGHRVRLTASIGIARAPEHADDPAALVRMAEVAMYAAKADRSTYRTYDATQARPSLQRLTLSGELRDAIAQDDLEVWFQPVVSLHTGRTEALEALVRWRHADRGVVPPSEFVGLAETSGLIGPLTHWLVEHLVATLRSLPPSLAHLNVAVNLSVRNLFDTDLHQLVEALATESDSVAPRLRLEITEHELLADPMGAAGVLRRFAQLGIPTVVDDFGTGYSSLAYLKHLPIAGMKIDRTFVAALHEDRTDRAIVRSTIDLARRLGLHVTAEGVADADALGLLAAWACDAAQGYWLSPPVPEAEVAEAVAALDRRLAGDGRFLIGAAQPAATDDAQR